MNLRTLIRRSLRFHWRAHLGVVLGAAVGSAALIGAFVVGDSVKESLRQQAIQRLGKTSLILTSGDRLFRSDLAERLISFHEADEQRAAGQKAKEPRVISAILRLPSTAVSATVEARANQVQVLGVDPRFWKLAVGLPPVTNIAANHVVLNEPLARQLQARTDDEILLRIAKPKALSQEVTVSPRADDSVAMRTRVAAIVSNAEFGAFNPQPSALVPFNAMLSLEHLQNLVGETNRANLLLLSPALRFERRAFFRIRDLLRSLLHNQAEIYHVDEISSPQALFTLRQLLADQWTLDDAQLELKLLQAANRVEMRTRRVFLDSIIGAAVWGGRQADEDHRPVQAERRQRPVVDPNAKGILTYLANLLRAGTNTTPYSMVTAAGSPWTPPDLRDDEIVVSQWLAEDLLVKPGDEIALTYFDPESGARLVEHTNTFRVRSIVPMEMPWADRTLMPDFPGIEKAESTSDWDAGFPLTYKIRQKDEDYWKRYRGTPKAFITLAAGQKMWANRFGNLTAIRFPISTNDASILTPALSLRERENHSPVSGEPKTDDSSTVLEKSKNRRQLSPLPGGEGQGEGEHKTQTNQFDSPPVLAYKDALEKKILANLKPEELGLRFEPVREQALKAAKESQDFGGLFLGFSIFLIAAALLLMALLFSLGLEQRAPEIGTLLALGFTPKQVRKLLLWESAALSLLGGILGTFGGLTYARAMLHGLTTVWRDAVGGSAMSFHYTGQTLIIGLFASVGVSVVTIWLTLRKFVRRPAIQLLTGADLEGSDLSPLSAGDSSPLDKAGRGFWWKRMLADFRRAAAFTTSRQSKQSGDKSPHSKAAWAALLAALGLVGYAVARGDTPNAGVFFGAGALVLLAGLAAASAWLQSSAGVPPAQSPPNNLPQGPADFVGGGRRDACPTLGSLAMRGCARHRKRSLSTIAMLACGSFLIVSIGVFRLDANRDAWTRSSGTGGFALIGETTMPVVHDLNSESGRDFFALNERDLEGVSFVPFRVREGDEASCLNLNRAQRPRLLGVKPELMKDRFSFTKTQKSIFKDHPWWLLKAEDSSVSPSILPNEVAAIGDANSIQWAMKKKVGDTIDYVDERGQAFKVRIVGAVANSILQGQLIIDEAEFVKRFPGESGHRMFLIDAPSNSVSQVSATLSRALQDVGLELTPAAERLAQFNAVQNTYLGTFQVLGGLGLLLGSVGLGIVVLRNVLERRGELAVLLAVGFRKMTLQRLLIIENGVLLTAGLALGIVAAAVAVLPALLSPSAQLPFVSLALTLAAVLANGALWTWAATRLALWGDLLRALRNE